MGGAGGVGGTAGMIDAGPGGSGPGGGGAAGEGPGGIAGATAGRNGDLGGSTAGTSGGVGGWAGGGRGGTGAGGGAVLPMCLATALKAGGLLLDPTGADAGSTAGTEGVTVSSVESCAAGTCPCTSPDCGRFFAVSDATRFVLAGPAAGQQRILLAVIPGAPPDLVKAGDALDLSVISGSIDLFSPRPGYQIVLSRAGKLVLFTSNQTSIMRFPLPDLTAFGLTFTPLGPTCANVDTICTLKRQSLQVTRGTEMGVVTAGQTVQVGALSVSAARLDSQFTVGGCDLPAFVDMAGFIAP